MKPAGSQTTLCCRRLAISSLVNPNSASTSSVCSPNSGGRAAILFGVRGADEVATMTGRTKDGGIETVRIVPAGSPVANYAFDVTPARLVSGLITERGVLQADRVALAGAFPERARGM
jgi:methylthioribose-1-phosphate isomerase